MIMKTKIGNTLLKTSLLILICALLPVKQAIPACLFTIWIYQYIIAFFFGVRKMPTMDAACFYGTDKANVNIMSYTILDRRKFTRI